MSSPRTDRTESCLKDRRSRAQKPQCIDNEHNDENDFETSEFGLRAEADAGPVSRDQSTLLTQIPRLPWKAPL